MDSGQFRTYFRFDKHDVRRLHRALRLPEVVSTPQCVNISGVESLCLTLRRLAYPNRLQELEPLFGRHYSVISSATNAVLAHIESTFGHLLRDVNNHLWLDVAKLEVFSQGQAPFFVLQPSLLEFNFFLAEKEVHAPLFFSEVPAP
ncbi:hypothetical protein HPB49_005786 [Dermacentor silvarum]|uniref:Uncharacterized protein n=1 Tax=Dermacentor silvarum TaxID=543639 RepID=A0ACB8DB44_DERSI|nr:hypothetical protein HPB49_005786 [Dermacentor silvarum]